MSMNYPPGTRLNCKAEQNTWITLSVADDTAESEKLLKGKFL